MEAPRSVQVHEQWSGWTSCFPEDMHAPKATQFKLTFLQIHYFHFLHLKNELITTISNSQDENALPSAKRGLLPDLLLVVLKGSWPGEAASLPPKSPEGSRATSVWLSWCITNARGHSSGREYRVRSW